jgi:hypothetical protein
MFATSSNSKCLFCDNKSLKYEGLCSLCKWERWQLPRKKNLKSKK